MPNHMTVAEAVSISVGPATGDFNFETPPTFDSVEDERRYRKQELAVAFRCSASSRVFATTHRRGTSIGLKESRPTTLSGS